MHYTANISSMNLFEAPEHCVQDASPVGDGAYLFKGQACAEANALLNGVQEITAMAPLRHMQTPGGFTMSVAMSNAGRYGWVSDRAGYRYSPLDPLSGKPWPTIPAAFMHLAQRAASLAGYADFCPDVCLINEYAIGAKMSLHQDRDEQDFAAPIVSVSLGLSAVFLFGGLNRSDKTQKILLEHCDVLVFGGASRLRFHGVLPLKAGYHAKTGEKRINLTFRKAY